MEMCNRIQATKQQRSGITWRKKKNKQNNNKQNKKRRKKKTTIRRGIRQEEKKKKKKNKKKNGKKKVHYSKNVLVKIWGSNFYRHFFEKKYYFLAFFWNFDTKIRPFGEGVAIYIYIYMCAENLSKIWRFLSWKAVQGWAENLSKIVVCLFFPQFYTVFGCVLKNTNSV